MPHCTAMNFHAKPSYDANMHGIRKNWMYWLFFANISLPKVVETIRYDTNLNLGEERWKYIKWKIASGDNRRHQETSRGHKETSKDIERHWKTLEDIKRYQKPSTKGNERHWKASKCIKRHQKASKGIKRHMPCPSAPTIQTVSVKFWLCPQKNIFN